ncbi:solute carrier family 13 member 5 [Perognathus longimembris pacificus]|uniref:solute carrier family 13 member 5 n=1 Tax=Perognathus longimembris pacificus TaxID=214514 RepID=UPI00201856B8|nr:solute carrier family 13 member 5 [Perognathus longimembris pacificus]
MASVLNCLFRLKNALILFCTPILLLPLIILVPGKVVKCAFVILLMAIYWCTDVIPMAITSLFPALLFPLLRIMDSKQVCFQYMTDTNMLFVGSMVVAVAVERWNLHRRIALKTLLIVGSRPTRLMMGFMAVTAFLSMWISNTATTAMMVPILEAMMRQMEMSVTTPDTTATMVEMEEKDKASEWPGPGHRDCLCGWPNVLEQKNEIKKNMYKAMNLSVCYAASIGGTATLTGTGPNVVLLGQMQELFPQSKDVLNFASWFAFAFPNMLLMLVLSWLWLYIFYMRTGFCTDATVALFVAVLLFVLPSKMPQFNIFSKSEADKKTPFYPPALLDWKGAQQKIPWGIVLLLGGGFALAKGCETSGLSEWMGQRMEPLRKLSPTVITLVLSLLVALCTECTSNVATTTLFLPIFASMARTIGINPLLVMLPCTLSASFAFMLPVATPPNAIVFSYGHIRVSDMMKTGVIMNIIGIFCVLLSVNTWGRPIFGLNKFPDWANLTSTNT